MLIFPCIAMMRDPNLCPRTEKVLLNISGCKEQNNSVRKKGIFFCFQKLQPAGGKTGSHLSSTLKYYCSLLLNWMMILQISKDKHASILPSTLPSFLPSIVLLSSSKFTRERRSALFLPHILESQGFLVRETHTLQYPINHCE